MLTRIAIGLFLSCNISGCSKEGITRSYGFLNLRIENKEEDIKWETVTATWIDSLGNANLEAYSYFFDRCSIHLKNITTLGNIDSLTLTKFYYTDGIDFHPFAVSGTVTITQADDKAVRGSFNLYFNNNYNGVSGITITGDFGIINKLY